MRTKPILILLLAAVLLVTAGCGGGKGGTVSNMWSDVPTLPDSKKADFKLPLPIRLIMQTAIKASASNSDVNLDKFDFVGYSTSKSPQEVTEFYTQERMSEAGWNKTDQPGCMSGSDGQGLGGGGFASLARMTATSKACYSSLRPRKRARTTPKSSTSLRRRFQKPVTAVPRMPSRDRERSSLP